MSVEELETRLFALTNQCRYNLEEAQVREAVELICEQVGLSRLATEHVHQLVRDFRVAGFVEMED